MLLWNYGSCSCEQHKCAAVLQAAVPSWNSCSGFCCALNSFPTFGRHSFNIGWCVIDVLVVQVGCTVHQDKDHFVYPHCRVALYTYVHRASVGVEEAVYFSRKHGFISAAEAGNILCTIHLVGCRCICLQWVKSVLNFNISFVPYIYVPSNVMCILVCVKQE